MVRQHLDTLLNRLPWLAYFYVLSCRIIGHNVVLYTKKHPIYTTYFKSTAHQYHYLYISNKTIRSPYFYKIAKACILLHVDASSWDDIMLPVQNKIIMECEAKMAHDHLDTTSLKGVIFQSAYAKSLSPGLPNAPVVYPSVDVRHTRKPKSKSMHLLAVGYGSFIKGFDVVFEIYRRLRKEFDVTLQIAGAFGHNFEHYPELQQEEFLRYDYDHIRMLAEEDPNVQIRSERHSDLVKSIYSNSSIYLHMSRMDTFGFSILEAMAAGIPVVTVDFKAIPEMIQHNVNGFLCTPFENDQGLQDVEQMKTTTWAQTAIEQGITYCRQLFTDDNLRVKMGERNREKVLSQFSHSVRHNQLNKIYLS